MDNKRIDNHDPSIDPENEKDFQDQPLYSPSYLFSSGEALDQMPLEVFFDSVMKNEPKRLVKIMRLSTQLNKKLRDLVYENHGIYGNMTAPDVAMALKISSAKLLQADMIMQHTKEQEDMK